MFLGALIDAGVPLDAVRDALGRLAVDREAVWIERVTRTGIQATKFCVRGEDPLPVADDHRHQHHHEPHRSLAEIHRLIDRSALLPEDREQARDLFRRLAEVEAGVHGVSVEDVQLHELGTLDSIVDIVGSVCAVGALGIDRVVASPLNVGGGTICSAHGQYPVPAPATLRLLEGAPVYAGPQQAELVTPTGALLVTGYASEFGPVPAMRIETAGYGAGTRSFKDWPNVLRVIVGETRADDQVADVTVIEAEIDDMNPQLFGLAMDRLLAAGALDVYYTAVQMKKNRPGTLLTVIAPPALREELTALMFRETTTIGVRYRTMARECLERDVVWVTVPGGEVRVKVSRRGREVLNVAPEFEDCVRVAAVGGQVVKDVQAAALRAYHEQQSTGASSTS